jgi:hypothetical protein
MINLPARCGLKTKRLVVELAEQFERRRGADRERRQADQEQCHQPASSSVGMYQMTDAAFAEAQPYCIRDHIVVENGCSLIGLDSRVPPSRAIELTAVFLDRNVTAILTRPLKAAASTQQKRELGAIIHLCGASSAKAFARRGFHPIAGERCGDQEVATYLAQINVMTREFLRIEAER